MSLLVMQLATSSQLFLALLVYRAAAQPNFDAVPENCCTLSWEPMIPSEGWERFLPPTALPFSHDKFGMKFYFVKRGGPNDGQSISIMLDDSISNVYESDYGSKKVSTSHWTGFYVLSNPNNCVIDWQRSDNLWRERQASHEFPVINGYFLVADDGGFVGMAKRSQAYGIFWDEGKSFTPKAGFFDNYNFMSINCAASLRRTLQAELIGIEFDAKALVDGGGKQKVLSLTEVINESDFDQDATINLESEVVHSLKMTHDTQLYSLMDTEWAVHGSVKTGWIGKMFGLNVSIDGKYDSHSLKENFTRTGQASFDSSRKQFKYNQKIVAKARTKTRITMNTQPISGDQPFKAIYRINTKNLQNYTLGRVCKMLRRQGYPLMDNLKENEKGEVILTVEGRMQVDSGIDTHILIESTATGNKSDVEKMSLVASFNTRRVVALDQLSLPQED